MAGALDIENLTKWVVFISTVGGAIVWFYKKSIQPAIEVIKDAGKAHVAIERITKEFLPNGGSTLRDTIDRIEGRQIVAENRQRAILSETHIGIFETDSSGRCFWVNRTYLRMCGKTLEEVKGFNWISALHPEDRDRVFEEWSECLNQQREFDLEYRIVNSTNNTSLLVKCHTYVIMDIKGEVCGYVGTLSPVGKVPEVV